MRVPLWEERCAAALAAAAAMPDFGLLGWDIAATSSGPVIVEVNDMPDVILSQIADRRGIMEPAFRQFLDDHRRAAKIWEDDVWVAARKESASSPSRLFSAAK